MTFFHVRPFLFLGFTNTFEWVSQYFEAFAITAKCFKGQTKWMGKDFTRYSSHHHCIKIELRSFAAISSFSSRISSFATKLDNSKASNFDDQLQKY